MEGEPGLFRQRWHLSEEGFRWGSRQHPVRRTVDARGLCLGPWQGLETWAVEGLEIQTNVFCKDVSCFTTIEAQRAMEKEERVGLL